MLKKALEAYEGQLHKALEAGGEIPVDGGRLALRESTRRTIRWAPEVLNQFLAPEQLQELKPTIGKGDLEDVVAAGAPRGQKGKRKEACLAALADAGAVEETKFKSIEFKKV
jgi:hypothetical protein